ncbi:MAG: hypothetical protein IJL80_02040 [Treponema sp.]|nr:hypothetical protein [Treponema sp.]
MGTSPSVAGNTSSGSGQGGAGQGASGSGSSGSGASSGGSQSGAGTGIPDITDRAAWDGKSFREFKFETDRKKTVRVTLKANLADWHESFNLVTYGYYNTDVGASVYPNRDANGKLDGTGTFEKELDPGLTYYVLSKQDGGEFTILNVEEI